MIIWVDQHEYKTYTTIDDLVFKDANTRQYTFGGKKIFTSDARGLIKI